MTTNFSKEVKLFMVFDILGDIVRTGPKLWYIDRKRLEDVKNHTLDLLLIFRILRNKISTPLDSDKILDYILCHDLPEAITGDITKFEGVPEEEIQRVTELAIQYLINKFSSVMDLDTILNNYENKVDLESKIVHMIDKLHSATTFIKYQSEQNINMNDPRILPCLRNHPFVVSKIAEKKDLADIFFEFHMQAVTINEEECEKYAISKEEANNITNTIRGFANEFYHQKLNATLLNQKEDFPKEAMTYNRNKK